MACMGNDFPSPLEFVIVTGTERDTAPERREFEGKASPKPREPPVIRTT
jgi:hypothetical protein